MEQNETTYKLLLFIKKHIHEFQIIIKNKIYKLDEEVQYIIFKNT